MTYQFDYLIVGSGLFGSVFAHQMTLHGYKCLVIEKRNHIGGNCWSENVNGVNCHKYGPHTFHTNKKEIWEYVNQVTKFHSFLNRTKVKINDKIYSFPINLMTLYQIYGVTTPNEARNQIESAQIKNKEITNFKAWVESQIGSLLYELFYKDYTEKQWGRDPEKIPVFVAKRIPIRYSFEDNYFSDYYQGLPIGGYQELFKKLLNNIDVRCNTDYYGNRELWDTIAKKIIFTGKIDEYFNYRFDDLGYRGLKFDVKTYPVKDYQGCPVINYPSLKIPYTRSVEYKHFGNYDNNNNNSIVVYETPFEATRNDTPYYPINDVTNNKKYEKYRGISQLNKSVVFCGRIGTYTYNDMDKTIENALDLVSKERLG
jgi:UDP-galactopyranose mutase